MAEEAKSEAPKPGFREVMRAVRRMLGWGFKTSPYALPGMFFLLVITSLLPFASSYLDSRVIDEIVRLLGLDPQNRVTNVLVTLVLVVVVMRLLERTLWVGITFVEKINHFNLQRTLTLQFLRKAAQLDMVHYESPDSHNIIQKASDTYTWRAPNFVERTIWMMGDVIRLLSSVAIILTFSLPAFLLVLATTIPSLIANLKLGQGSWGIWDANAEDRRRFWRSAEMLKREESLMELRIFRTKDYLLNLVEGIYDRFTDKERKDQLRRTLLESLVGNLSTIGTMIFWGIAINATLNGEITLGLFTFYTATVAQFSSALNNLFRSLSDQYEDGMYLVDLFKFIDLENTVQTGMIKLEKRKQAPLIVFQNVDFAYPNTDKLVLEKFNLVIEPGEHVALVGANGAGKSTIIKLLCRFYDVTGGAILVNGVNLRDLDMDSWYSQVGVLFQEFIRYTQFDVKTNVELGDVDNIGDVGLVEEAIYKADAKSFVDTYEKRLEQVLDRSFDGGTNPSDGQWQKIALARAFFRDAPILVLDEPTSAIDAKAEYQIFERLYAFSENKSLIIISHRFSTVRNADKIFVIDEGKIAECGSHEQLMLLHGKYAEAFEAQAKGYK
ncbi:MAG: ABC transporter ATP-binding protein/permease [Anaerolineae bacterium]|nr:ABC transporter ATP-binding protein/permease [Anaerolineae bacterium]